jgi:hypothetical protein
MEAPPNVKLGMKPMSNSNWKRSTSSEKEYKKKMSISSHTSRHFSTLAKKERDNHDFHHIQHMI